MAQVLGRILRDTADGARGPDVVHKVQVEKSWFERGECILLALPRHVTCAACDGGGCDRCERSGAITLRQRGDPVSLLQINLPQRSARELGEAPSIVLRIPDQGGVCLEQTSLPRGMLLLRVNAADRTDPSIRLSDEDPQAAAESIRPPAELLSMVPPVVRSRTPLVAIALLLLVVVALVIYRLL